MIRNCSVLLYLVVSCILLCQTGCQEQSKLPEEPRTASAEAKEPSPEVEEVVEVVPESKSLPPKITFEKVIHDFGKVSPNKVNSGEIKFTNTGEGPLKITKVGKCCGVVATLDKGKSEYAPGENGAVKVEWKSGSQPLVFKRNLVVHSNDRANPATTLTIKAEVVLRVTWEPKRLRLLLDEENAGCPKVTISSLDGRPFSITGFKSTGDCITADYDPSMSATKFVLEPRVKTEKLHKNLKGRITVGLTHPDGNAATILFDVVPKYSVSPLLLIVFNAEPDKPIVRKISVLNNYGKDFEIESLTSKNDVVAVKVLEQRKLSNGYQLDVEMIPPATDGKIRFTDVFSVNFKSGEKLPITCNGYYSKKKPVPKTQPDMFE